MFSACVWLLYGSGELGKGLILKWLGEQFFDYLCMGLKRRFGGYGRECVFLFGFMVGDFRAALIV